VSSIKNTNDINLNEIMGMQNIQNINGDINYGTNIENVHISPEFISGTETNTQYITDNMTQGMETQILNDNNNNYFDNNGQQGIINMEQNINENYQEIMGQYNQNIMVQPQVETYDNNQQYNLDMNIMSDTTKNENIMEDQKEYIEIPELTSPTKNTEQMEIHFGQNNMDPMLYSFGINYASDSGNNQYIGNNEQNNVISSDFLVSSIKNTNDINLGYHQESVYEITQNNNQEGVYMDNIDGNNNINDFIPTTSMENEGEGGSESLLNNLNPPYSF
jgi:hypothetical protein